MSRIKNSQDIIESMVVEKDSDENTERDFLLRNNANNVFSVQLINKNITERAHAQYLFEKIISKKAKQMYDDGVIYIHDKSLQNYCVSLDMKQIALEGIPTIAKNINASAPTKNFFTFMRHISNAVTLMSNQISGAVMLANFSTIVGSYVKYHTENKISREITEIELYREIKHLVWELNIPLRNGAETPFTNITMEFNKASDVIADDYIIIGGEALLDKYSELESNYIDMVNSVIIDVMSDPPGHGKIYTFPLITVQVDDEFDKTNETYKKLIKQSDKFGGFYIENFKTDSFLNSDFKDVNPLIKPKDPTVSRSLCCVAADTKLTIYENNLPLYMSISELLDKYDDDSIKNIEIDSLNPITFKIERTKISGMLKKRNDSQIFHIKLLQQKEIFVTHDHPLLIKNNVTDEIFETTAGDLFSMSNIDIFSLPVV
jgi:ribonucleoside-triphosphate reductase